MVGLFKKLGKKKKRNHKNLHSASEDESATEDESYDKVSYLNNRNSQLNAASNGIRDTPKDRRESIADETCSETSSISRNSFVSSIGSPVAERRVSFEIDQIGSNLDVEDSNDADNISISSANEGSLFDEDVLSSFQDGHISLQQFLQSPHLSRCENRVRDDEIDSIFSDTRSVESSTYYSESSSEGEKADERERELDRIASELFGDYGEKFLNSQDPRTIKKTGNSPNFSDGSEFDYQASSEFKYKANRDSYCSIGNETITNSCDDLTICDEPINPCMKQSEKANSRAMCETKNDISKASDSDETSGQGKDSERDSGLANVSVQFVNASTASSNITIPSPAHTSSESIKSNGVGHPLSDDQGSPPSSSNAYTPRRQRKVIPENLPISPTGLISSPADTQLPPPEGKTAPLSSPERKTPPLPPREKISDEGESQRRTSQNVAPPKPMRAKISSEFLPLYAKTPAEAVREKTGSLPSRAKTSTISVPLRSKTPTETSTGSVPSRAKTPTDPVLMRAKTPTDSMTFRAITPTDQILMRAKTPTDHIWVRAGTPSDLPPRTDSPFDCTVTNEASSDMNSRPASTGSNSQREIAIVDNTVISMQGNYVIKSEATKKTEIVVRGKSPHPAEKVDPWLSYLPPWKDPASNSTNNSPSKALCPARDRCISRLGHVDAIEPGYAASDNGLPLIPSKEDTGPINPADQDRYIRFSSLQLDFFIPPPPVEEDTISTAQEATIDAVPFNLEWDYEISDSPTLTPSSSVIYLGSKDNPGEELDPIAESLLGLLPLSTDSFESSITAALGEIITEIVASRQKFARLHKTLETQENLLAEQRKEIQAQAREIAVLKNSLVSKAIPRTPTSPRVPRRNEFRSYPATGRRSKELVDLENTLDKLLFQCHTLQRNSATDPDLQVFQPIEQPATESRDFTLRPPSSTGSETQVKTLLHKKIPESPANHVQIVPAKGVVYKSCKETKEDLNAIQK